MKSIRLMIIILLLFANYNNGEAQPLKEDLVTFEGVLVELGPAPKALSGAISHVYRLAKYRVDRVCKGAYSGKTIALPHVIVDGKEFDGVKTEDRLCVTMYKGEADLPQPSIKRGRKDSRSVEPSYVGVEIKPVGEVSCACSQK